MYNIFFFYVCVICNPPAEWSASGLCSFLFRLSKLQITVPRRQLIRAHILINQHVSLLCLYSLWMKSARNCHGDERSYDPLVRCRIDFHSRLLNTSDGPFPLHSSPYVYHNTCLNPCSYSSSLVIMFVISTFGMFWLCSLWFEVCLTLLTLHKKWAWVPMDSSKV